MDNPLEQPAPEDPIACIALRICTVGAFDVEVGQCLPRL